VGEAGYRSHGHVADALDFDTAYRVKQKLLYTAVDERGRNLFAPPIASMVPNFRRMAMPTIQKPQLDHVSFPWREQSDRFHMELDARRAEIFERSGFNKEFGNSDNALNTNEEPEGAAFILELSGILSQAAAIKMDGGYKPANKVIATLKSIKKNPSLILNAGVEPEALAMVSSSYQRAEEKPGTFWFDIDRPDDDAPDPQRVRIAASVAIKKLLPRRGQPRDVVLDFLGDKLLRCFLRFNATAGRHSVAADGDRAQAEAGPFFEYLSLVIAPLNRFLVQLPTSYGAKSISVPELARRALRRSGKNRIRRVERFHLHPFSMPPNSSHN
jgi:hypothetical protein